VTDPLGTTVLGISAALGSSLSWAMGTVLLKTVGDGISSLAMTLAKGAISLVLITVVLAVSGLSPMGREALVLLSLSGLLGIAVSDTCFFEALKDLGPLPLVLVLLLGQVLTVVFAVLFLGERPSPAAWVGIGLVLCGLGIVLTADLSGGSRTGSMRGFAFGLASLLSMAVSTIIAKKALADVSAMQATFVRMAAGTLGIFILGGATGRLGAWMNPFADLRVATRFFLAVCVVTFGGFWLSLLAIKNLDVSLANTLIATEPVFVLPLAAIFLREKITGRAVAGTFVAVAGIVLICLEGKA
jgi:drug/metabolite transporter (DMT)-like permease